MKKNSRYFFIYWIVNSGFLYFAPYFFGSMMVVGNMRLTPFLASVISGFLLAVVDTVAKPALESLNIHLAEEWQMVIAFEFINIIALWVLARYADLTGVGITNVISVGMIATAVTVIQWLAWKFLPAKK